MNAIDTNLFVYAVDAAVPEKQLLAQEFLKALFPQPAPTVLLWQVAVEFCAVLRKWARMGRIPNDRVDQERQFLMNSYPLILPTANVIDLSFDLTARYSLSHWDSLLIASCIEAGIDTLYSEDMGDGTVYDSVTVVNPLKSPSAKS